MKKMDISVVISCVGFLMVYTSKFLITWNHYKNTHEKGEDLLDLV